jgi:hypothetical protein
MLRAHQRPGGVRAWCCRHLGQSPDRCRGGDTELGGRFRGVLGQIHREHPRSGRCDAAHRHPRRLASADLSARPPSKGA